MRAMSFPKLNVCGRLQRETSGASAVEFVLVLPVLALLLFGVVDVSGLAWAKMQVGAAARAGASYALTNGFDEVGISNAATNATGMAVTTNPPTKTFGCANVATGITEVANASTPCPGSGETPGNYVTVGTSANYSPIFGWPGLADSISLTGEARVRIP